MSDKQALRNDIRRKNLKVNKKRRGVRAIIVTLIAVALVYFTGIYGTSIAYLGDFISKGIALVQFGGGWPSEGDFSDVIQSEKMGTGLCVLTKDSLEIFSPTAKSIQTYNHSMQKPVMATSGSRVVLYDLNSTSLKVLNGHRLLFSLELSNNIVHTDISDSNRIAVTTRSSSFNGEVTVYNYSMRERFTWYCATGYPVYTKLSSNGHKMAVETVQTIDGILKNEIYVLDSQDSKELFSIISAEYPLDMIFTSPTKLLVIYPQKLVIYNADNGEEISEYSFSGYVRDFDITNSYIALSHGSQVFADKSTVTLLSTSLEEKFSVPVSDGINSVSVSQSRVFALGDGQLYEFDYQGTLRAQTETGAFSKSLVDFGGTKLIRSTDIMNIKKAKS